MSIYFVIYAIESGKRIFKSKQFTSASTKKAPKIFVDIPVIVAFFAIFVYLSFKFKIISASSSIWVLLIYINGVINNLDNYIGVFKNPDDKNDYRLDQESSSFYMIMLIFWLIVLKFPRFLIIKIHTLSNATISDLLLITMLFVYCSILISFIIGFILLIIKSIFDKEKLCERIKKLYDVGKFIPSLIFKDEFYYRLKADFGLNSRFVILLIMFIVERILNFVALLLYIFRMLIYMIYNISRKLIIRFYKFLKIIVASTKEKDLSLYIRLSIIISLLLMVIENEYSPFLRLRESTNILEFIASSIIIPLIFESISKLKKSY